MGMDLTDWETYYAARSERINPQVRWMLPGNPTQATKDAVRAARPDWQGFTLYKNLPTGRIFAAFAMGDGDRTDLDVTGTQ